jgi:hypothetical protein
MKSMFTKSSEIRETDKSKFNEQRILENENVLKRK